MKKIKLLILGIIISLLNTNTVNAAIDVCTSSSFVKTLLIVKIIMQIICFAVPVILIVSAMITLTKSLFNDEAAKANLKTIMNKLVLTICVFLVPTFVNLMLALIGYTGNQNMTCLNFNNIDLAYIETLEQVEKQKEQEEIDAAKKAAEAAQQRNESSFTSSSGTNNQLDNGYDNYSGTKIDGVTYIGQCDAGIKTMTLCNEDEMCQAGCGYAAYAMVANNLNNGNVTIRDVIKYICDNKIDSGSLSSNTFMDEDLNENFNLSAKRIYKGYFKKVDDATNQVHTIVSSMSQNLQEGKYLIAYVPGHYITIGPGCPNGQGNLLDPGAKKVVLNWIPNESIQEYKSGTCVDLKTIATIYTFGGTTVNNNKYYERGPSKGYGIKEIFAFEKIKET